MHYPTSNPPPASTSLLHFQLGHALSYDHPHRFARLLLATRERREDFTWLGNTRTRVRRMYEVRTSYAVRIRIPIHARSYTLQNAPAYIYIHLCMHINTLIYYDTII